MILHRNAFCYILRNPHSKKIYFKTNIVFKHGSVEKKYVLEIIYSLDLGFECLKNRNKCPLNKTASLDALKPHKMLKLHVNDIIALTVKKKKCIKIVLHLGFSVYIIVFYTIWKILLLLFHSFRNNNLDNTY